MPSEEKTIPPADPNQFLREFISGGHEAALAAVRKCLPTYIDTLTRDLGPETYEQMLTDPDVYAAFDHYKKGILADGIRFAPAIEPPGKHEKADPEKAADAALAGEYQAFVDRCLGEGKMDGPELMDVMDEMLDGMAFGHKVAEIVLKWGHGIDVGKLVVRGLKTKKRTTFGFVIDSFSDVIGFLGARPEDGTNVVGRGSLIADENAMANFVPRQKFLVFQHAMKDGDPRGTSVLRAAYNAWFMKTQVIPEFFRFLKQFASPGIIGKTPMEGGSGFVPKTNADGTPVLDENLRPVLVSAESALMNALLGWLNAAVVVVKGGTEIDFLQSEGDGKAFLDAQDYFGRQIYTAILGTAGLSMEAKHDSQGAKGASQDVVGLKIAFQKGRLAAAITRDLIHLLIRINFPDARMDLAPKAVLAKVEQQDQTERIKALAAAYAAGFIHESQLPALDAELNLPERDMEAIAREKAERKEMERLNAGNIQKVMNPGGLEGE